MVSYVTCDFWHAGLFGSINYKMFFLLCNVLQIPSSASSLDLFASAVYPSCSFLQAIGGHGGWTQWHPVRLGAFRGAWLAGLHLHQTDGADAAAKWRETSLPQHRARRSGWHIRGKVTDHTRGKKAGVNKSLENDLNNLNTNPTVDDQKVMLPKNLNN